MWMLRHLHCMVWAPVGFPMLWTTCQTKMGCCAICIVYKFKTYLNCILGYFEITAPLDYMYTFLNILICSVKSVEVTEI